LLLSLHSLLTSTRYELIKSSNLLKKKICEEIKPSVSNDSDEDKLLNQVSQLNTSDMQALSNSHESTELIVSTLQIPHVCQHDEHLHDPRLVTQNDSNQAKQNQINDFQLLDYRLNKSIEQKNEKLNNLIATKEQSTSNLPISIMSILFKNETKPTIEPIQLPIKTNTEVAIQKEQIEIVKEDKNSSTKANPVFDRIQNFINKGISNEATMQKKKQAEYMIENKGLRIQRTKPYPSQDEFKSELILAFQQEKVSDAECKTIARPQLTLISKVVRNRALEKRLSDRCQRKLNSIIQNVQRDNVSPKVYNLLNTRSDLVSNLKHLMNYDYCVTKLKAKKKSNKKQNRKKKKNDPLDEFSQMFTEMEPNSVYQVQFNNDTNANEDDLDLYGDLAKQIDLQISPDGDDFLNEEKENKVEPKTQQVMNETNERCKKPRSRDRKRSRSRCSTRSPSNKRKNSQDYHRRSNFSSSRSSSNHHRESDRYSSRSRRDKYY
jgi:hypothetical protein